MPRRKKPSLLFDLLHSLELKNSREEFRTIHSTFSPVPVSRLDELQPRELELLACWAFQNLGYSQVIHSGAHSATDGGADVRMRNQKGNNEIVQCKQLNKRVDQTEIKKFARSMRIFDAERGHYWAPSGFTSPAMEYAKANRIFWYDEQRILRTVSAANKEIERRKQSAISGGNYVEPKTQPRPINLPYQTQRISGLKITILIVMGSIAITLMCGATILFILGPSIFNSLGK